MKNIFFLFIFFSTHVLAQNIERITLDECYNLTQANFPLVKQRGLIKENNVLNINTLKNNYLPQIELNAQATYQSDVTSFPVKLPNIEVTPLSKDQYKATLDVKQILWDGGVIKMQEKVLNTTTEVEFQKIEVEVAKLKERVNQLYFNILQVDENEKLLVILKSDIAARIKKMEGAVANGVALKMNLQTLQAEDLKVDQRIIELKSARAAAIQMLNLLIAKELDEKTIFQKPTPQYESLIGLQVSRPELTLFDLQKKQIDQTVKVFALKNFPRLFAFATGGYGRPGLNFLKNDFAFYGIGGLTFKWNLADFYSKSLKNDLQVMKNNAFSIDIQKDIFLLNTNITTKQQSAEITKLEKLIEKDRQILTLREKIKQTAAVQLENGVMTANDYLLELNAESQARQNLILHELQMLNAKINLATTLGK
ncbi:MAG: TolC family protein [Saprospiraceae bacterium]|nr:TolC family protein [Saprospiraceae bacterium]